MLLIWLIKYVYFIYLYPFIFTYLLCLCSGRVELSHVQGQGWWPRGATPRLRSGGASREDIPLVQGKEQWLRFAGAAVKRYPMSKVRETQVRQ